MGAKRPRDDVEDEDDEGRASHRHESGGGRKRKVALVYSDQHVRVSDRLPANRGRSSLVHELIRAYGLLDQLEILPPSPATDAELASFHARDFVAALKSAESRYLDDDGRLLSLTEHEREVLAETGLEDDCPVFEGLWEYCRAVVGGTLTACRALARGDCTVAIHWDGGRHHGRRARASGFCYVNDIVIGIIELRKSFERVLYIDIDAHHGDAVESAFYHSNAVMTVSFHKYERGFFPGTGALDSRGSGQGHGHAINVPLRAGIGTDTFVDLFESVVDRVCATFRPSVVVMQCGTDGLATDPTAALNLSCAAYVRCLRSLLSHATPLLLLGGGGYSHADAARVWVQLTGVAVDDRALPADIPHHDCADAYSPYFSLHVRPRAIQDENSAEWIAQIKSAIDLIVGTTVPGGSTSPTTAKREP